MVAALGWLPDRYGPRTKEMALVTALSAASLAATGLLTIGLFHTQVAIARRVIGEGQGPGYFDDGIYGAATGIGEPRRLLVLGDSTAAGVGAGSKESTVGAIVATGMAAIGGRPVELRNVGRTGDTSPDLLVQVRRGLQLMPEPEVALIMIGANDVKNRVAPDHAVACLASAVGLLREAGADVIVGTCPDLGTIRPIPQPLRWLVQRWSRDLAAAQTVAVVRAGGRTVSTGDLLGPAFRSTPQLFSADRFHPSASGYARAAAILLPSVFDAIGITTLDTDRAPDRLRGERVEPLHTAAERAVKDAGSEVSGTDVGGHSRSPAGRWAQLLRRHRHAVAPGESVEAAEPVGRATSAGSDRADARR